MLIQTLDSKGHVMKAACTDECDPRRPTSRVDLNRLELVDKFRSRDKFALEV